jgi:hypothetical protein
MTNATLTTIVVSLALLSAVGVASLSANARLPKDVVKPLEAAISYSPAQKS